MGRLISQLLLLLTTALFMIGCGGGGGSNSFRQEVIASPDDPDCESVDSQAATDFITISGTITFDRVPTTHSKINVGLDYEATRKDPVRSVMVEAVQCDGTINGTSITSSTGSYSVRAAAERDVAIRVKAIMLNCLEETTGCSTSVPSWQVAVRDNTSQDALYVVDDDFITTGLVDEARNFNASSGFDGSSYSGVRQAAPFAILDSIYTGIQKVLSAQATTVFAPLTVFWSENNRTTEGDLNEVAGELPTTFFTSLNGADPKIFVLGKENEDTDEYDDHIILHEWGHYFEDQFSRSDSFGGPHSFEDKLDPRVAFSEGFGNAWSAIMSEDRFYVDTSGSRQSGRIVLDLEDNDFIHVDRPGWFVEASIGSIIYDLYDDNDDGVDNVSLGLGPILEVLQDEQKNTLAFTSIFPFINALKANNPSTSFGIDDITSGQEIDDVVDDFATGEDNFGGLRNLESAARVYTTVGIGGSVQVVCVSNTVGTFNKLANSRFLKLVVNTRGTFRFNVARESGDLDVTPVLEIYDAGIFIDSASAEQLQLDQFLAVGTYVLEVYEASDIEGPGASACFSVAVDRI